ncbi:MAG: hypothetical protein QM479_07230 [Pseudomonadota bacterium]
MPSNSITQNSTATLAKLKPSGVSTTGDLNVKEAQMSNKLKPKKRGIVRVTL